MIHLLLPGIAQIALAKPRGSPPPCSSATGVIAVAPKDYFAHGLQGSASLAPDVIQTTDGSVFITLAKAGLPSDATWTVSPSLDGGTHDFVRSPVGRVDVSQPHTDVNITLQGHGLRACSFWVDFVTLDAVDPTPAPIPSASAAGASPAPSSSPKTAAPPVPAALPATSPAPEHLVAVLACMPWGPEHLGKASTQVEFSPAVHIVDPYLSYAPSAQCVQSAAANKSLEVLRVSGRVALGAVTSRTPGFIEVAPLTKDRTQIKSTLRSQHLYYQLPANGSYLSPTFALIGLTCAPAGTLNPLATCIASAQLLLPPNMNVAGSKTIALSSGAPFTTFSTNFKDKPMKLDWQTPNASPPPSTVMLSSVSLSLIPTAVPLTAKATITTSDPTHKQVIENVTSVGVIPYASGTSVITQTGTVQQLYRPIAKFSNLEPSPQAAPSPDAFDPKKKASASPSPSPFPQPSSYHLTSVEGEFDAASEGDVDLTVSGKFPLVVFLPTPTPTPAQAPRQKASAASPEPTRAPVYASLKLAGVGVNIPMGDLRAPDAWVGFKFGNASLDGTNTQSFLGHEVESCQPGDTLPKSLPQRTDATLCMKLSLEPGTVRSKSGDDTLFALATIADCIGDKSPECTAVIGASRRFRLAALSAAPSDPIKIRFGAGVLNVESLQLDFAGQAPSAVFDDAVGKARLTALQCDYTPIVGSATIEAMTVNGTATSIMGIASNAATPLSAGSTGSISLSASPQLAIGPNCTAFAMSGYLPLQPSLQSSLILTRLVYVHSVTPAGPRVADETLDYVTYPKQDRTFMEIGGTFTSGNVTIVINSLSLRTLAPGDACPIQNEAGSVKEWRLLSGTCVLADINWNASAKITGIENTSTIVKTVENVLSGVVGYLAHAVKI